MPVRYPKRLDHLLMQEGETPLSSLGRIAGSPDKWLSVVRTPSCLKAGFSITSRQSRKGSFAPIGPGTVPVETVKVSYTTQSRFGSFTYKRFTVPQEVHRSAKRVSRFSLSDHLKKPFFFSLQRRPGRTSPPPPEAETVRPLMSCEPPQYSHVFLGMDNYSPRE